MGRTKGSKNGISTTPGYVAIGEKAQEVPVGYKKVLKRYAGRAGGPVHYKYELVPDENYGTSKVSTTNTEEPEEDETQQEEEEVQEAKASVAKGPDNDIARRVEQIKARQKAAGSEYAKQLYKLKLKREQAKQEARERAEATDIRNVLRQTQPQAARRINSPSDAAKYRENENLLKEVSGMLNKAYAKRTKGSPTINSAYDLATYKAKTNKKKK